MTMLLVDSIYRTDVITWTTLNLLALLKWGGEMKAASFRDEADYNCNQFCSFA